MRNKLLGVLAGSERSDLHEWLLKQPTFKDSAKDNLVQKLVEYLTKKHEFDEAQNLAKRNMTVGYNTHTNLEKYILQKEIAYLKKKKGTY
jgi:hypothetical protein